jgi:hypothetical protein
MCACVCLGGNRTVVRVVDLSPHRTRSFGPTKPRRTEGCERSIDQSILTKATL